MLFTGLCLAIGVATWIFSAIKFQADMGLMLTFMFLWNMLGALWLLPALACFLIRRPPPPGAARGSGVHVDVVAERRAQAGQHPGLGD